MKEFVVGSPYTTETTLDQSDEFLIVACDGVCPYPFHSPFLTSTSLPLLPSAVYPSNRVQVLTDSYGTYVKISKL